MLSHCLPSQENIIFIKDEFLKLIACLVEHFNNMFSVFKQQYTYFHTFFSPTRISKKYKQHYSNYSTKQALNPFVTAKSIVTQEPFVFKQTQGK